MSSRKDFKKYLFDKIQDFPGYWEPCKHNQTRSRDVGWFNFFSRLGFYLNDPLCIMAIEQNMKKEKKGWVGVRGKRFLAVEEVCYLLIVRKVLNKKHLGAAESCLFQRGWVGLLFSGKAGQDSAREVCNYLKLLWSFFQRE